jgi:hypothetical protein
MSGQFWTRERLEAQVKHQLRRRQEAEDALARANQTLSELYTALDELPVAAVSDTDQGGNDA